MLLFLLIMPIIYNSKTENILKVTYNWFKGKGISSWRKDLEKLLERLNISSNE